MTDLLESELRTLRMVAGQLPSKIGLIEAICLQELEAHGLCTLEEPRRITVAGLKLLEALTGTLDFLSRRPD